MFSGTGTIYSWQFTNGGVLNAPGPVNPGSDERLKSNIVPVKNALAATMSWRGATYEVKDGAPSVGLIAQDVEKFCPEAISVSERTFKDGTTIEDFKNLNVAGASAAYHTEAIKELFSLLEMALTAPDKCRERSAAIKSLISEKENFTS
ncbi:tail fiber domain-containing protein [Cedecea davisae]|uniref:tail fiber domain-containing protein n=1 Tax=Cedecea davisae TaxID=158484 RepID=UPI00311A42F9